MDIMPVEPLSQRDPRWRDLTLGEFTGHSKTIGNWGCLMVAYDMMARVLGLSNLWPGDFNKLMRERGGFYGPDTKPAALKLMFPDIVLYDGYITKDKYNSVAMDDEIRSRIRRGIPVPARVDLKPDTEREDQHWVLIIKDNPLIMADPWTGKVEEISNVYDIDGYDVLEILLYDVVPGYIPLPEYAIPDADGDEMTNYYVIPEGASIDESVEILLIALAGTKKGLKVENKENKDVYILFGVPAISITAGGIIVMESIPDNIGPVEIPPLPVPEIRHFAKIAAKALNFRKAPQGAIITAIPNSEIVELLDDDTARQPLYHHWVKVRYMDNIGYVWSRYITDVQV